MIFIKANLVNLQCYLTVIAFYIKNVFITPKE